MIPTQDRLILLMTRHGLRACSYPYDVAASVQDRMLQDCRELREVHRQVRTTDAMSALDAESGPSNYGHMAA